MKNDNKSFEGKGTTNIDLDKYNEMYDAWNHTNEIKLTVTHIKHKRSRIDVSWYLDKEAVEKVTDVFVTEHTNLQNEIEILKARLEVSEDRNKTLLKKYKTNVFRTIKR